MKSKSSLLFKILLPVLLLLGSCKENTIQPELVGSIEGVIYDAQTNQPVPGVAVTTNPPSEALVSNSNGEFIFQNLSAGNYAITAEKDGYEKSITSVQVKSDQITRANIFLAKESSSDANPEKPVNLSPENLSRLDQLTASLVWESNNEPEDSIRFTVYLFSSLSPEPAIVAENIRDTFTVIQNLKFQTTYFWQVISKNSEGEESPGDVWSFSTRSLPLNPYFFVSDSTGNFEIFSTDGTRLNTIQLTDQQTRQWYPRINAVKNILAYSSDEELNYYIYTMNTDGSNKKKISSLPVEGMFNKGTGFSWSPDGGHLIYPYFDKLYRIDSEGSASELIATAPAGKNFQEVSFDPTGTRIIYTLQGTDFYDNEIWIFNSDGSDPIQLVSNLPGYLGNPSFSPNGRGIIYVRDIDEFESPSQKIMNAHIFYKSLVDTVFKDLSINKPAGTNDLEPRFSPDGASVIFTNSLNTGAAHSIYVMNSEGSDRRQIVKSGRMPDWK